MSALPPVVNSQQTMEAHWRQSVQSILDDETMPLSDALKELNVVIPDDLDPSAFQRLLDLCETARKVYIAFKRAKQAPCAEYNVWRVQMGENMGSLMRDLSTMQIRIGDRLEYASAGVDELTQAYQFAVDLSMGLFRSGGKEKTTAIFRNTAKILNPSIAGSDSEGSVLLKAAKKVDEASEVPVLAREQCGVVCSDLADAFAKLARKDTDPSNFRQVARNLHAVANYMDAKAASATAGAAAAVTVAS